MGLKWRPHGPSGLDQHAVFRDLDLNTFFVFVGAQTLQDFADV